MPEPDFDRCVHADSYLVFGSLTAAEQQAVMPLIADWGASSSPGARPGEGPKTTLPGRRSVLATTAG